MHDASAHDGTLDRSAELARIARARSEGARVVVLVGPGGVGKSWIARRLPDVHAVVPLAHARTDEDVLQAIAEALDRPLGAAVGPGAIDRLGTALAELSGVLVLDAVEGVAVAVAGIAAGIGRFGTLVVTSRRTLGVGVEVRVEGLASGPAARLFLAHAATVAVASADDGLAAAVAEGVGGNPLALRMAAGQLQVCAPAALLRDLAQGRLLDDPDVAVGRHASMDAVVAGTISLLPPDLRDALRRLCAFAGRFTAADARAVGVASSSLLALHRWSLLARHPSDDAMRFGVYDEVRRWIGVHQPPRDDDLLAVGRHLAAEAEVASAWMHTSRYRDFRVRILQLLPDLVASIDALRPVDPTLAAWLYHRALAATSTSHCAQALALTRAHGDLSDLLPPWERVRSVELHASALRRTAHVDAAIALFDDTLAGPLTPEHRGWLLSHRALCAQSASGCGDPLADAEEAVRLLAGGSPARRANADRILGTLLRCRGRSDEADAVLRRAQALFERIGQIPGQVNCLAQRIFVVEDVASDGRALVEAGMAVAGDDPACMAILWTNLAMAALEDGLSTLGREAASHALPLLRDRTSRLVLRVRLAMNAALGDLGEASVVLDATLADVRAASLGSQEADLVACQGFLAHRAGRLDDARAHYASALRLAERRGRRGARGGAVAMDALAAAALGQPASDDAVPTVPGVLGLYDGSLTPAEARRLLADHPPVRIYDHWIHAVVAADAVARTRWRFAADGSRFVDPAGTPVDLRRRRVARRIVAALARRRVEAPGAVLPSSDLIAAAWPDERMLADSARMRLHTAISGLRRLGLRPVLQTTDEGYRLDPDAPVRLDA